VRAALLEIGKICSESRKVVLDKAKSLPVKTKAPKEAKADEPLPDSTPALERQDGQVEASDTPSKKPRGRRPKAAVATVPEPEA
jgi:hypothetical protein